MAVFWDIAPCSPVGIYRRFIGVYNLHQQKDDIWINLSYYTGICLETLRKTGRNLCRDSRSAGRDLDKGPPKFEGRILTNPSQRPTNDDDDDDDN